MTISKIIFIDYCLRQFIESMSFWKKIHCIRFTKRIKCHPMSSYCPLHNNNKRNCHAAIKASCRLLSCFRSIINYNNAFSLQSHNRKFTRAVLNKICVARIWNTIWIQTKKRWRNNIHNIDKEINYNTNV